MRQNRPSGARDRAGKIAAIGVQNISFSEEEKTGCGRAAGPLGA
jgi:hypothetical protein